MSRGRGPWGVPGRRRVVVAALLLGAAALGSAALTWVTATTSSALETAVPLAVAGSDAAPGVPAGGLVVLAAGLALSIGGRFGRLAAATGIVLGGILVVVSSLAVVRDPGATATSAARDAVGVAVLDSAPGLTPAGWVALLVGCLMVLVGVATVWWSRSWAGPGGRYERDAAPGATTPPASSDATASGGSGPSPDERDTWDALTRGEDPT